MSSKSKIFISYARADDEPFAESLYHDLQRLNFEPWYDRENMTNDGAPFSQAISEAILQSERFLLIVGEGSVKSKYCRGEWETALKHCIPIVPLLRLGDYHLIPLEMDKGHAIDCRATRPKADYINELDRILKDPVRSLTMIEGGAPSLPDWYVDRPQYIEPLKTALRTGDDLLAISSKQEVAALQGIGGIGKTTLASALCHDCEVRRTFTRILWIEAGTEKTASDVPNLMRAAIGGSRDDYETLALAKASFARELAGSKTLIVLDDVWDTGLVQHFRLAGQDYRLLITTRQKGIVQNLGIRLHTLDRLNPEEAQKLLESRAGRALEQWQGINDLLAGHSLALTLAGAWLAKNSLKTEADLLARLQGGANLAVLNIGKNDKNENLELALSLSYVDLDEQHQAYYRALGIFAPEADFDLAAAQALWQITDTWQAEDTLALLRDVGLVDELATGHYRQHPLLRAYARALQTNDERATLAQAHFGYYHAQHSNLNQNNDEDTHNQIATDWGNIQTALAWGFEHQAEQSVDWVYALQDFMQMRRSNQERLDLLGTALAVAKSTSYRLGEAHCLFSLGVVLQMRNDYGAALDHHEQALSLYRVSNARLEEAHCLHALGDMHQMRNDYRAAVAHYEQALPLFRAIDSRLGVANCLLSFGEVYLRKADYKAAVEYYEQALPLFRAIGARLGVANCLLRLGDVQRIKHDYGAAIERYEQVLSLFRAIGDRIGEANCLFSLGEVQLSKYNYEAAMEYYEQALPLFRTIGDQLMEASCLQKFGYVHRMKNEYGAAVEYYEQALPLFRTIGDRLGEANCLFSLGDVYLSKNEYDLAVERYKQALLFYRAIGNRLGETNCFQALGEVHLRKADYGLTVDYYEQALSLGRAIGDFTSQLNSLKGLAFTYQAEENLSQACVYAQQLLALADSHEFFKSHPVVQGWRKEFASWGCG